MESHEEMNTETPINPQTEWAITNISRWVRYIAIFGFSVGGFIVTVMLFNGASVFKAIEAALPIKIQGLYTALVIGFFILFFIAAAVLYFLYKASQQLIRGLLQKDTFLLAEGFRYLKNFFIVMSVYGVIMFLANLLKLLYV